ncbi:MAG: T9SS type A sorting domain-containing protein, partial [Saprospiraceae bacterium]|nr:T9SS type A sorting domain-containing protein [Saprospiraceae bacterium]
IPVTRTIFNEPAFNSPQVQPLEGCCTNFCSLAPCTADFTWVYGDCYEVTFTATSSTCFQGMYTYEWDFDGNGIPDVTMNSPTVSYTFPCGGGGYNVCLTVTEPITNCVATICKPIIVDNCINCVKVISSSLKCNPNDFDAFDFTIVVQDMTPASFCGYNLINLPAGWALSNFNQSGFPVTTITGTIHISCPTPTALNLTIQANCNCQVGGSFTCPLSVSIPTICCRSIEVPDAVACETDKVLDVHIQPFGTLCNVTQVSWFVRPKPANGICPTVPWGGLPYQQTNQFNVLEPLHLFPANMSGDVCIYAEVLLNDGPCTFLRTNIACVRLCAPVTCNLVPDQNYCYTGTCITPTPLQLNLNVPPNGCHPSIQWYDPMNNGVQQGGTSYSPTQCLDMANPLTDCYEDFFYTVRIADFCGVRECKARIRLYSDDAPKGSLDVQPYEANTLCPYEDITLQFTPGCDSFDLSDPKTWDWYTRPCDPSTGGSTQLSNAGTMNPNWNTNILQTSAYYYVATKNGVCPEDTVQVLLEVKDPLMITSFTAASDPCAEQQVLLDVQWAPCTVAGCPPGTPCTPCPYTVEWYKDCMLIGTTNEPAGSTSSSFPYATLPLAGNYYAVVKDDCCPNNTDTSQVATIDPACFPVIDGPCFRCENETVTLTAAAMMTPTMLCNHSCTYAWSSVNGPIGTGPSVSVSAAGTYTVTISCFINGGICSKSISYTLIQCQRAVASVQNCGVVSVEELLPPDASPVRVFPNPTAGGITVEWTAGAPKNARLLLSDATGRVLRSPDIPDGASSMSMNLDDLQPGVYFIKILAADRLFEVAKVVKQ